MAAALAPAAVAAGDEALDSPLTCSGDQMTMRSVTEPPTTTYGTRSDDAARAVDPGAAGRARGVLLSGVSAMARRPAVGVGLLHQPGRRDRRSRQHRGDGRGA